MAQFNKASARRIAQATRRAEATPRNQVLKRRGPIILPAGCRYAVVTQAIGLRSGNALGSGKAQLQRVTSDTPGVATFASDGSDPVWCFSGAAATGATIAVGRLVILAMIDSVWPVIVDFC